MAGVAERAEVLSCGFLAPGTDERPGALSDALHCLAWCRGRRPTALLVTWHTATPSQALWRSLAALAGEGVVVVAAAAEAGEGEAAPSHPGYPAAYSCGFRGPGECLSGVVSVGALAHGGGGPLPSSSLDVDVLAPGELLRAPGPLPGEASFVSGTQFAAAIVAGVVAAAQANHKGETGGAALDPSSVRQALLQAAAPLGPTTDGTPTPGKLRGAQTLDALRSLPDSIYHAPGGLPRVSVTVRQAASLRVSVAPGGVVPCPEGATVIGGVCVMAKAGPSPAVVGLATAAALALSACSAAVAYRWGRSGGRAAATGGVAHRPPEPRESAQSDNSNVSSGTVVAKGGSPRLRPAPSIGQRANRLPGIRQASRALFGARAEGETAPRE